MSQDRAPRRQLSHKEVVKLAAFTLAHYAARGLTDGEFAAEASRETGIPDLKANHIEASRAIHDIPSTKQVNAGGDDRKLLARLDALARESERADHALAALAAEVERLRINQQVLIAFAQQTAGGSGLKFHLGGLK